MYRNALATLLILIIFSVSCFANSTLDGLSELKDYRAMRASSSDLNWKDGNADSRPIKPGQTLTLADLDGPGRIAHIWFTISHHEQNYGKLLVLRMYWDGEENPSVECPVNDFFCEGHGLDMYINSLPVRVTSDGRGRNCYWPMPFRKSAKITVTNEGKQTSHIFYYIDWQKMDKLPPNTAYFHAQYRQEYPCKKGQNYLILDAEGRGHYVGCNLSVRQLEPGWWGEGDDFFFVDGETEPSLKGTGSEDYFCDGWGIRKLEGLYYGFPISEGYDTLDRHVCYRFHIQDPVSFKKSLRVEIEHKGERKYLDGTVNGYVERSDDFSSVAYWYQTEPHKKFPPFPNAEDRIYKSMIVEAESLIDTAEVSENAIRKQDWKGGFSGGSQLFFTPSRQDARLVVKLNVQNAGKYHIRLHLTKSHDYGIYSVYFKDREIGPPIDLYEQKISKTFSKLGVFDLTAGEHIIKFECKGKNPISKGYYFGLDYIELTPLDN